jgi:hypothetical protein
MKPQIKTLNLSIPVGEREVKKSVTLPKGIKIYAGVVALPKQDQIVNISMFDNGTRIQEPSDVTWYDGAIGPFENRAMFLHYDGGSELEILIQTQNNIANNVLNIQVVFQIHGASPGSHTGDRC